MATRAKPPKAESLAKQVEREIAKREAIFKKASPAQKRVLIAKDVIAQIKARKYKPETGSFLMINKIRGMTSRKIFDGGYNSGAAAIRQNEGEDADARKLYLENKIQQCSCCALGGMFMSCTLYNNHTTASEMDYANADIGAFLEGDEYVKLSNGLDKFFSLSQLRLIEQTFEGDEGVTRSRDSDVNGDDFPAYTPRAKAFHENYKQPKARLLAIMKNIVANNGTFKP